MNTEIVTEAVPRVSLAHGGGGLLTRQLIADRIIPRLGNSLLNPLDDGAILPHASGQMVFTTDSFVVQPLTFPGGDIGRLAVCGTVNDLAVMGAVPQALSLALIIEEGLPVETLERLIGSISQAAGEANVPIATGDTKVIERRGGDGMFITTAGLGMLRDDVALSLSRITAGDRVIITGNLAEHGLTIMAAREGIEFDSDLQSDVAPLNGLITAMLDSGGDIKFLRDPTRGGLAGVLCDMVEETHLSIQVEEAALPIPPIVRHTSELLGLDPLTIANEGKCVVVVSENDADGVLRVCRQHPLGRNAAIIGTIVEITPPLVELHTPIGGARVVQRPHGEELPRIC